MADIVKRVDGLYTRREPWNWEPIRIALQNHNFTQYAISALIETFPANWSAQIAKIVNLAQATIIYQDYKASPEGKATGSIQRIGWLTKHFPQWMADGSFYTDIINPAGTAEIGVRINLRPSLIQPPYDSACMMWTAFYPRAAPQGGAGGQAGVPPAAAPALFIALDAGPPLDPVPADGGGFDPPPASDPATTIVLPHCMDLFGGMDATASFSDEQRLKPGLFKFAKDPDPANYTQQKVHYERSTGMGMMQPVDCTFSIPPGMNFTWSQVSTSVTIAGEDKASFQSKLSDTLSASLFADGFGFEMQSSFGESDFTETYKKYASHYERHAIYNAALNDTSPAAMREWLSKDALTAFEGGDAEEIVRDYGTHFMTSATFGGVKRTSAVVDIRDSSVEIAMGMALDMKVSEQPASKGDKGEKEGKTEDQAGGGDSGSADTATASDQETARKIYSKMETLSGCTVGGSVGIEAGLWELSLYDTPTVIEQSLIQLDKLIKDEALAARVAKVIKDKMDKARVQAGRVKYMYDKLQPATNGKDSGAPDSISYAGMVPRQGWYSIGGYAVNGSNWDTSQCQGLLFQDTASGGVPRFMRAVDVARPWGERENLECGLFEMVPPPGYIALSGAFFRSESASVSNFGDGTMCLIKSLCKEGQWAPDQLWSDYNSGASECGKAWDQVCIGPTASIFVSRLQHYGLRLQTNRPRLYSGSQPDAAGHERVVVRALSVTEIVGEKASREFGQTTIWSVGRYVICEIRDRVKTGDPKSRWSS